MDVFVRKQQRSPPVLAGALVERSNYVLALEDMSCGCFETVPSMDLMSLSVGCSLVKVGVLLLRRIENDFDFKFKFNHNTSICCCKLFDIHLENSPQLGHKREPIRRDLLNS